MTKSQFLLLKLMEECDEVSQRASKQIQFGKDEVQKGQPSTNSQRLVEELVDLIAVAHMLWEAGEIPDFPEDDMSQIEDRKAKVERWLKHAVEDCGLEIKEP